MIKPMPLSVARAAALCLALCNLFLTSAARAQNIRYVAPEGDDTNNDGLSFESPKASIAAGIAALGGANGQVVVSNGTYEVESQIVVTAPVTVSGYTGDPADVVVRRAPSGPDTRVFMINNANARVEFLTIRDGVGQGDGNPGGNLLLENGTVADCLILNGRNEASNWFGGNAAVRGNARLLRCVVAGGLANGNNTCSSGAILINGAGALVEQCLVTNNVCGTSPDSSTILINTGGGTLANCTIAGNTSVHGALSVKAAACTVVNCVIVDNIATTPSTGGGVFNGVWPARFFNCVTDAYVNDTC
ncbi:MAG: hypothetical protein FWF96_01990, partial [Kiritimatiellaeota bacterium]|nr:hypothetical protein [Kiritimatiellota bacterium]